MNKATRCLGYVCQGILIVIGTYLLVSIVVDKTIASIPDSGWGCIAIAAIIAIPLLVCYLAWKLTVKQAIEDCKRRKQERLERLEDVRRWEALQRVANSVK